MDTGSLLKVVIIIDLKKFYFHCHLVDGCLIDSHATSPILYLLFISRRVTVETNQISLWPYDAMFDADLSALITFLACLEVLLLYKSSCFKQY